MSSVLAPTPAPSDAPPGRPRSKGRRRLLATLGLIAAVTGGMITNSPTASAQPPSTCAGSSSTTGICPAPPAPQTTLPPNQRITQQQWNNAAEAADFWANHTIDWNTTITRNGQTYNLMYRWNNHGWPITNAGWYAYWDAHLLHYYFVYTGELFRDAGRVLENHEVARGVPRANATGGRTNSHWTEWDINYWSAPGGSGINRGSERIVRNWATGHVYATFDHYRNFFYLGTY